MFVRNSPPFFGCLIRLGSLFFSHAVADECYFPSGDEAGGNVPCYPDLPESPCCAVGWACLENDLCSSTANVSSLAVGTPARGSCTDPSFSSTECPQFCLGGSGMVKLIQHLSDYYKIALTDQIGDDRGLLLQNCPNTGEYCCSNDCDCSTGENVITVSGSPSIATVIQPMAAMNTLGSPSTATVVPQSELEAATTIKLVAAMTETFGGDSAPTSSSSSSASPSSASILPTRSVSATASSSSTSPISASSSSKKASSALVSFAPGNTSSPSTSASTAESIATCSTSASSQTLLAGIQTVSPALDPHSSISTKTKLGVGIPLGMFITSLIAYLAWSYYRYRSRSVSRSSLDSGRSLQIQILKNSIGAPQALSQSVAEMYQLEAELQQPEVEMPQPHAELDQPEAGRPHSYPEHTSVQLAQLPFDLSWTALSRRDYS
ncbi:hypothetical protein MMC20_000406 [Loxospora ochrophaea]|nr:hypothetical protein [Loxospora ochrophaea]